MPKQEISQLFTAFPQVLVKACLEGSMGELILDQPDSPKSGLARIGKEAAFGFLAGQPNLDLIESCRGWDIILVPEHEGWNQLIETTYGANALSYNRYATRLNQLNQQELTQFLEEFPAPFSLHSIDQALYQLCLAEPWAQDLVANYDDFAHYQEFGLGFAILKGQDLVSGASSFASSSGAIDIEIDTHPSYRRQGLARVAAARLLLACQEKNITPSWDAHNMASLKLAEQLGFEQVKSYQAYEIIW